MKSGVVFHGSATHCIETVEPRRNLRIQTHSGKEVTVFDQHSFHATVHRWIALAYTDTTTPTCAMGVDLYGDPADKVVGIYGPDSLEASLQRMYGKGGYLYSFCATHFFHTTGLGNLELITKDPIRPLSVLHIQDPVGAMKAEGVTFEFMRR